jgi:hypothetical protein
LRIKIAWKGKISPLQTVKSCKAKIKLFLKLAVVKKKERKKERKKKPKECRAVKEI